MKLSETQKKVYEISKDKGFHKENLEQKFMLLFEEVGELAKSVRELVGTKTGRHSAKFNAGQEASDVLFVLIDICNKINIDIEAAFNKKLSKIHKRYSD